ncbi:unnamed protein product [Cunninghamella blakesleeana]
MDDLNNNDHQLIKNTYYTLVTIIPISLLCTIIVILTHLLFTFYKCSEVNRISLRLLVISCVFNFIRYIIRLVFLQNAMSLACSTTVILTRWLDNISLLCIALVCVHSVVLLVFKMNHPLKMEKYYYLFIIIITIVDIVLSSVLRFEILNQVNNCWFYIYFDYTAAHHTLRIWYVSLLIFIISLSVLCALSLVIKYLLIINNPIRRFLQQRRNNSNNKRRSKFSLESSASIDSTRVIREVVYESALCSLVPLICGILTIISEFQLDHHNYPPPGLITAAFALSASQGILISIIYFMDPTVGICFSQFERYIRKVYVDDYHLSAKKDEEKESSDCHYNYHANNNRNGNELSTTSMDMESYNNSLHSQKKRNPYRWPWLVKILHFILSYVFCMKPQHDDQQHEQDNRHRNSNSYTGKATTTTTKAAVKNPASPLYIYKNPFKIKKKNKYSRKNTNVHFNHTDDIDNNDLRVSTSSSKVPSTPIIKNIDSILPPLDFGESIPLSPILINGNNTNSYSSSTNNSKNNEASNADNNTNNTNHNDYKGKNKLNTNLPPLPPPSSNLINVYDENDENAYPSSISILPSDEQSDLYNLSIWTNSSTSMNHNNSHMNVNSNNRKPSSTLLPPDQQSDLYDLSIWTDSSTSMNRNNNSNNNNSINNNSINNHNKNNDPTNTKYFKNGSGILSSTSLINSGKLSIKSLPSTFHPTHTRYISEGAIEDNKKPFIYRFMNQQQQQHHHHQHSTDSSMSIKSIASSPPVPFHNQYQQHHHQYSQLYHPHSPSTPTSQINPPYSPSPSTSQQRLSFLQSPPLRRMKSPSILGSKRSSSSTASIQSQDTTNERITTLLSNRLSSILTGNAEDYYRGLNVPAFQYHQQQKQSQSSSNYYNNNNNNDNYNIVCDDEEDDHHFHPFKMIMKKKKRKNEDNSLNSNIQHPTYTFTTSNQHHSRHPVSLSSTVLKTLMRDDDSLSYNRNHLEQDQYMIEKDGLIYGYTMITHIKNEQFIDKQDDGDNNNRMLTLIRYWDRNYAGSRWFIVE